MEKDFDKQRVFDMQEAAQQMQAMMGAIPSDQSHQNCLSNDQVDHQNIQANHQPQVYQPMITQVNYEEANEAESSPGIKHAEMLMNQPVVKPGQRKFKKDSQGYTEPIVTFEGTQSASQHVPTPIPSNLTFRGDVKMNSRENTFGDNSATLPIMDNESDEDWSSNGSAASNRLNNIVIKKQSAREDQQMISQNSEPMDTSMRHSSNQTQPQMSSEDRVNTTEQAPMQRKTRENYQESLPDNTKPITTVEAVIEEEIKLSPRQNVVEHSTPQIKVAPLMEASAVNENNQVPNSLPLQPRTVDQEEEKKLAKSMMTLQNFGLRPTSSSSKLAQRRNKPSLKLRCDSWGSSRSGSVKQYSSEAEMIQLTLEENQSRCDFFKHFQYSTNEKLGTGCSSDVYMCQRMPESQDIQFVTVKSAHIQSSNSSTCPQTKLVVKVCDTSDVNKAQAALNESNILKKIECDLINHLVAFYEDPQVNKSYLVLEYAGQASLTEYISEKKQEIELQNLRTTTSEYPYQSQDGASASLLSTSQPQSQQQILSEEMVRCIMRQLFQAAEYMHRNNICHRDLKPDNIMISHETSMTQSNQAAGGNDSSSQASGSEVDPIRIKVIDLNVAFEITPENPRIRFNTGLKEWSAPETRNQMYQDFKIDSWTLGCVMYFISTGNAPFEPGQPIEIPEEPYLCLKLMPCYQNSDTFPEMVDFLSKLMVVDPENRMTSLEALRHPWLNAAPYQDNQSLRRLQMKVMTEEELADAQIDTSNISAKMGKPPLPTASSNKKGSVKSPLLTPSASIAAASSNDAASNNLVQQPQQTQQQQPPSKLEDQD